MVELRKRKEAPPAPEKPAKKAEKSKATASKAKEKVAQTAEKAEEAVVEVVAGDSMAEPTTQSTSSGTSSAIVGNTIDLSTFGGEIETHEGQKVTLKRLVENSKAGVVLFTYPKASTPGCKCTPWSLTFSRHVCLTHKHGLIFVRHEASMPFPRRLRRSYKHRP